MMAVGDLLPPLILFSSYTMENTCASQEFSRDGVSRGMPDRAFPFDREVELQGGIFLVVFTTTYGTIE